MIRANCRRSEATGSSFSIAGFGIGLGGSFLRGKGLLAFPTDGAVEVAASCFTALGGAAAFLGPPFTGTEAWSAFGFSPLGESSPGME